MSTISSQLIVTSSALVEDIYKSILNKTATDAHYVFAGRLAVLFVSVIAAFLAWNPENSVLELVGFAWAGFGAAFGPIILLALYWRKLTNIGALTGMVSGALVAFVWGQVDVLTSALYEIVPGFIVCLLVAIAIAVSAFTYKPNKEIEAEFDETIRRLKHEE